MKFDELNQLKAYYEVMDISDSDKKKRVELALDLFDAFYFVLFMIATEFSVKPPEIPKTERTDVEKPSDIQEYKESLRVRIEDVLSGTPYEQDYIPRLVDEVIDTTFRHTDDEYYTSKERALLIAQNESNSVLNYNDFLSAKDKGSKFKQWITEGDEKVRFAHAEVDYTRIPIDDFFVVGGEQMRYPHDPTASADNIVNCRCTCKYT